MNADGNSHGQAGEQLLNDADKLIWALLDEQIPEKDAKYLGNLIEENEQVRHRYLQCSQIHSDLYEHYHVQAEPEINSPVLGSLGDFSTFPNNRLPTAD